MLTGDAKDVDAAKKGEILFYREPELPAGAYQFETIVVRRHQPRRASARVSTVVVAGPESPRLRMSSLVLVARTEQSPDGAAAKADRHPPFYYGDTLLYPNVGEPLVHGQGRGRSRSTSSSIPCPAAAPARRASRCSRNALPERIVGGRHPRW